MDCMQRDKLQKLFEEHRRKRGFLQLIAEAMGGSFRKSQISTHLRKLGLKRPKASILQSQHHRPHGAPNETHPLSALSKLHCEGSGTQWTSALMCMQGNQPAFSSGSDSDSVNASGSEGGEGQGGTNTKKKRRAKVRSTGSMQGSAAEVTRQ